MDTVEIGTTKMLIYMLLFSTVDAVTFEFKNLENGGIWIGSKGNNGKPAIEEGGFKLNAGQSRSIDVPKDWAGKIWPRTWCGWPKTAECLTGDCGKQLECMGDDGTPPYTSIDITLKGEGGYDSYAVSLINGYNIAVSIEPVNGMSDKSNGTSCSKATCTYNFQAECAGQLQVKYLKDVIGCHSPCIAFATDEYCCHKTPNNPYNQDICISLEWRDVRPRHFKKYCPNALTYAHDNKTVFRCKADNYRIVFGGQWLFR